MDKRLSLTAEKVVNEYSEEELRRIIREFGEERFAGRIAQFIVARRKSKPIKTTQELVQIIKDAVPAAYRRRGHHPAKRTFQALRIEVNKELDNLHVGLSSAINWLKPGGRIVVITYHSLEDRIVKRLFKEWENPCICPPQAPVCTCGRKPVARVITRRPVRPRPEEVEQNPRARSAKLRAVERIKEEA